MKYVAQGCIGLVLYALIILSIAHWTGLAPIHWPLIHPQKTDETDAPPPETACIVPPLEGLYEIAANRAILQLGLQPVKSVQYDSKISAGAVLSQQPAAGTTLRPCQGKVIMVVSLGLPPWGVLTFELGSLRQHGARLWFRHA
jgi:PASTA domain